MGSRQPPSRPMRPASSYVSRAAHSSLVSSASQPPLGSIHSALRLALTSMTRPSCVMGMHPATCLTSSSVRLWTSHRCSERPCREELCDCSFEVKLEDRGAVVVAARLAFPPGLPSPPPTALEHSAPLLRPPPVAHSPSSSVVGTSAASSVLTTSTGGLELTIPPAAVLRAAIASPAPQKEPEELGPAHEPPLVDAVTMVEPHETYALTSRAASALSAWIVQANWLSLFSTARGHSSSLPLPPWAARARPAAFSASCSVKQTPGRPKSTAELASFLRDGLEQTGGDLIRPGFVGVSLPRSDVRAPYAGMAPVVVAPGFVSGTLTGVWLSSREGTALRMRYAAGARASFRDCSEGRAASSSASFWRTPVIFETGFTLKIKSRALATLKLGADRVVGTVPGRYCELPISKPCTVSRTKDGGTCSERKRSLSPR
mmetsp:Transcript_35153/g.78827  ORF Transcript_35153/g.78827 Transcript_35153/m.78827 type:complete len:431 (+) Transcript_35153:619-1911(+)